MRRCRDHAPGLARAPRLPRAAARAQPRVGAASGASARSGRQGNREHHSAAPITPIHADYPEGASVDGRVLLIINVNADGTVRSVRVAEGAEPLLYHLGLGPSVIHPAIMDRVALYPGGYPARFGRFAGGIVAGETRGPADAFHGPVTIPSLGIEGGL